ncbi:glutathione binding-like protein [Liquorilactobacillus nagelii]|jgi:glutathione S-transferase|uniref:glutathione binding-like protein n=1 Tax=Liquorilactobacillus nagelii TaxID=82688 RepID=UPI00242F9DCD|nr:glutathione binding-like protein [Liquorilactobacillus nagelii]MCI1633947.1 glutathione binding-like protein [Liquorilactobacillus nagelii]
MQLFYASGASSLAPHILLEESGLDYVAEKVNLDVKTWSKGDYNAINPKSYVPSLKIENGKVLSECAVILEYIAFQVPDKQLIGQYDSALYWEQRIWLNYIATELHKNFISPFRKGNWLPNTVESKELIYNRVLPRLKYVDEVLKGRNYLVDNHFSAPDAYLFVMTNWLTRLKYGFDQLENLNKFDNNMRKRNTVQAVLKQEGRPHSLQDQAK